MKTLLILLAFSSTAFCQIITTGPNKGMTVDQVIIYRMEGLIGKVKSAESENKKAQDALAVVQKKDEAKDNMIAWQSEQITNLTIWGNRLEHALKVLAEIAAILAAVGWLGTIIAGQILKNFPAVEGWAAAALAYVLVGLVVYYALYSIAYNLPGWIPTPPVWHDISSLFTKLHAPKL